jgi:hypothetical protein
MRYDRYIVEVVNCTTGEVLDAEINRTSDLINCGVLLNPIIDGVVSSSPMRFNPNFYYVKKIEGQAKNARSRLWLYGANERYLGWQKIRELKEKFIWAASSVDFGTRCKAIADTTKGRTYGNDTAFLITPGSWVDRKLKEAYNLKRTIPNR